MKYYIRRQCPICWQRVRPTEHRSIEGHWDSITRDICPGSGEPYRITLTLKPTTKDIAA